MKKMELQVFRKLFNDSEIRTKAELEKRKSLVRAIISEWTLLNKQVGYGVAESNLWNWTLQLRKCPWRELAFRINETNQEKRSQFIGMIEKERKVIESISQKTCMTRNRWFVANEWFGTEERPVRILDFGGGNGWFASLLAMELQNERKRQNNSSCYVEIYVVEPEKTGDQSSDFEETASSREEQQWIEEWIGKDRKEEDNKKYDISIRYLTWNGICIVEIPTGYIDVVVCRVSLHHMETGLTRDCAMNECNRVMHVDSQLWMKEHDGERLDCRKNADLSHVLYLLPRWVRGLAIEEDQRVIQEMMDFVDHSFELDYYGKDEWRRRWDMFSLSCVADLGRFGEQQVESRREGDKEDQHNYSYLFWHIYEYRVKEDKRSKIVRELQAKWVPRSKKRK